MMIDSSSTSSNKGSDCLVTRKSLALSLAAPRVPPHGTAHRALLMGGDHTALPWTRPNFSSEGNMEEKSQNSLHRRLVAFLASSTEIHRPRHPHLPSGPELAENVTRFLGVWLPLSWQNWLRDSGRLRTFIDTLLTYSAPTYALLACPDALVTFQRLTEKCQTLRYGEHPSHTIDLFFPEESQTIRGLVFFVHGGAWGSGQPWLYRLIAAPFLEKNLVVAIVGYRTYPCGDIVAQVHDLDLASQELARRYPQFCQEPTELGVCVMGHSSGAHISFLMMTQWTRKRMQRLEKMVTGGSKITASMVETVSSSTSSGAGMRIDSFVGISGPYNISHHFDYEASRGLEEISPMKPALRFSRSEFRRHSPALQIVDCLSEWSAECEARALDNILPRIALLHGMEDEAVPFTSTAEAARLLRACGVTKLDEVYFARCAHNECALQIMTGGPVRDTVLALLEKSSEKKKSKGEATKTVVLTSRL